MKYSNADIFKAKREIIQYARENGRIWDYTDGTGDKVSSEAIKRLLLEGTLQETTVLDDKNIAFYKLT